MIIGLAGYKRSGKNLTAEIMGHYLGDAMDQMAFADPLRAMAVAVDPIVAWDSQAGMISYADVMEALGYEAAKDTYPASRIFLQRLGSEGVRDVLGTEYGLTELLGGDSMWVALARRRARLSAEAGKIPVFTDVRFPDEADMIRAEGGKVIRVWRGENTSGDTHQSETALDGYQFDHTIDNTGTSSELWAKVSQALDFVQGFD